VSLGVKFMQLGPGQAAAGAVILVLTVLNCVAIEYHTFDFGRSSKEDLVVVNHPYRMVDDLLTLVALVAVNASGVVAGELLGVAFIGLRLALSTYFPFYADRNQQTHQAVLLAALIAALGVLVTNFGQQHYLFLAITAALLVLLGRARGGGGQQEWEEVAEGTGEGEDDLGRLRRRLFSERAYVRVFRELIILSRKNNSHRTLLEIEILKSKCTEL
jgi:hypothetical protein